MRKRWLALVPILFLFDRTLKIWANNDLRLRPGGVMELIPNVARLRFVLNTGAAFSLFSGMSYLLVGLTSLIMLAVLFYLLLGKHRSRLVYFSLTAVLAGGLGNLYDRLMFGRVIDYVEPLLVRFAIFNLADVFICVGAALCGVGMLFGEQKKDVGRREVDD